MNHLYKKIIHQRLSQIKDAHIIIKDGKSINKFGKPGNLSAKINILDTVFYKNIILGGTIGASESFIRGEWSSPNLTNVIRVLARNTEAQDKLENLFTLLSQPFLKVMHKLNENSVRGSKKNISRHYDLSNDFFSLFLDKNMMYSSAIYKSRKTSLEDASTNKLDVICKKLNLKKTDHVIEIGTGWGGFINTILKQNKKTNFSGYTISKNQFEYVQTEIPLKETNLDLNLLDYRKIEKKFDKIISIEMFEAVGQKYWDTYFDKIYHSLNNEGKVCLQIITINDASFNHYADNVDFIQKYIFPGGMLPSKSILLKLFKKHKLELYHQKDFGHDYAKTLIEWKKRFNKNWPAIKNTKFDERFNKIWNYYFDYCETGFSLNHTDVSQFYLKKVA